MSRRDILKRELKFASWFIVPLALLANPFTVGSRAEAWLFPVMQHQVIPASLIVRTDDRLCWTWIRDKLRNPQVMDIDISLDTAGGDRSTPEIHDEVTGVPWHRAGARPPGHYEGRFCARLPYFVKQGEPIRLRQTLVYDGLWSLWTFEVPLPDVTG